MKNNLLMKALAFLFLWSVSCVPGGDAAEVSSLLTIASPTWNRISDRAGNPASANSVLPYQLLEIKSATGGTLSATISASTQFDSFLALYSASGFIPGSPSANLLAADDDSGGYPHAQLSKTGLSANSSYYLVVTSYSNQAGSVYPLYGNYSLTLSGDFRVVNPNLPPLLGGTFTTNGAINDTATISPFSGVTVSDANGDNVGISITYPAANGTLTGTGLTGSAGNYTLTSGAVTTVIGNLHGLVFHPTTNQVTPGSAVVTNFTITPGDGTATGTGDGSTKVTVTSVNDAPAFVGATTTLTVNQNSGATDIKGLLHVSDPDSVQTETWTQSAAPGHGTLNFSGATSGSGGSDIIPGGAITYTPTAGYSGSDSFSIQVSDGTATATRTIGVTVNPTCTVTFISNGGSPVDSQTVAYNTTATAPATPTRIGYAFGGWYSDSELTTTFNFSTPITGDTTLYAKWIAFLVPSIHPVENMGANLATLVLQSSDSGSGYFTLLAGSSAPCGSAAQIKAGQNSNGDPAPYHGSLPLVAETPGRYTVRNLTQSAAYTVCFTADSSRVPDPQEPPATADIATVAATTLTTPDWNVVGTAGFSAGISDYVSQAFAPDGTPYVAYKDTANNGKATVMKYVNGTWSAVGSAGFTAGAANYTSMAFAPDGTPYVAYSDDVNSGIATVMKYDNGSWNLVGGAGLSAGKASFIKISFAPDGSPWVACQDEADSSKAMVMKYSEGTWSAVGSAGVSAGQADFISLAFAMDGTPHVTYQDALNDSKVTVKRLNSNGTSWDMVGGSGLSAGLGPYPSSAFAPDGTLYVAYQDLTYMATVMKCSSNGNGTCIWELVGNAGLSAARVVFTSLAFDPEGIPYVAYAGLSAANKATVMKYNTGDNTWSAVGTAGFSAGSVPYISLAFGPDGIPCVFYKDRGNGDKVTMMKLRSAVSPTATTGAATSITSTGATLNGTLNANYGIATVSFDYGLTTDSGKIAIADQSPVRGGTESAVSATVSGLTCGTTYHFWVVGTNIAGTAFGLDQTFTTSACPALTVTINGNGSVTSHNETGTNSTCDGGTCAPVTYGYNDTVTLTATGSNSTFAGWSGDYSGDPTCNPGSILMSSNKSVIATFTANPATVKIDDDVTPYYAIGSTLNGVTQDATVRARDLVFGETIILTNGHNLKLRGGFTDNGFSDGSQSGFSTISGSLTITSGKLTVERLKIKAP